MIEKVHESRNLSHNFTPMIISELITGNRYHERNHQPLIYTELNGSFAVITHLQYRFLIQQLALKFSSAGFKTGDTILLMSFSCNNELPNALVFGAAACLGIRLFIPMFPEPSMMGSWLELTDFSAAVMPADEINLMKAHEQEKLVVAQINDFCRQHNLLFLDTTADLKIPEMIDDVLASSHPVLLPEFPAADVNPQTEAVIFTTSGSSGNSKLVVYTHENLMNSCQAWEQQGLFAPEKFGNPIFTPLFTHTIGIRTWLNCLWAGNPFCIIPPDWFITKTEQVRCLLMQMQPGSFIAGPAFFNNLLELFRMYPELKAAMQTCLHAAISIGARYDMPIALKFRSATGIMPMNAFGTTETFMVMLHEAPNEFSNESLGKPMPGVAVCLQPTDEKDVFSLLISSEFQASRFIGEADKPGFFATGDLVIKEADKEEICFLKRESEDFIKDEYGVKIPFEALHQYYPRLFVPGCYVLWIPLAYYPGLAALIIRTAPDPAFETKILAAQLRSDNEILKQACGPFEYMHRHLERISVVYDELPLTRKGTVSVALIRNKHASLIEDLRNPFVHSQAIKHTEKNEQSDFSRYSDPLQAQLMEALRIDKEYFRGQGDYLYYREKDQTVRVTDYVGGFGAGLLGHNHPEIKRAMTEFLTKDHISLNNQGSQYKYSSLLAKELSRIFGKATGRFFRVLFGNSGTEALEIALQHAYYAWRRKIEKMRDEQFHLYGSSEEFSVSKIWDENLLLVEAVKPAVLVVADCFHGYSSAARSLLNHHKKQRSYFSGMLAPKALHIDDRSPGFPAQIEQFLQENVFSIRVLKTVDGVVQLTTLAVSTIIASVYEPVRGEGGIRSTAAGLSAFLSKLDFPLIADEIQCGMGRTGHFPASGDADYYLLGKSLGGGFEKISAILIDDNCFRSSFTRYYNATFANGELAAFTALKTIGIINREDIVAKCAAKGLQFKALLQEVASSYPDIIGSVEGEGLMIGVHFNPGLGGGNSILRIMIEHEKAGYLFSGWLLHNCQIRVLPSLSKPNTLRLEPSAYISPEEMQHFASSLKRLCEHCRKQELYDLCKFLMNDDPYPDKAYPVFEGLLPHLIEAPHEGAVKVGFVGNFTLPHRELQIIEPDFQRASDTGLRILFNRLQVLLEGKPFKLFGFNIRNSKVYFSFYTIPFDTSQLEMANRYGKKQAFVRSIQKSVDLIAAEGAVCMSLGAHTSIISGNGLNLAERNGCRILTGNTVTVASVIYHLKAYLAETTAEGPKNIAIVGAAGNIGSGIVECLSDIELPGKLILNGNNLMRLNRLKKYFQHFQRDIKLSTDMFDLQEADIIICCVNTNDPVVFAHHLHPDRRVFIIDISVPRAVSEEVRALNRVHMCYNASHVRLAETPEAIYSTHTPKSRIFCCAGEAILTGMYSPDVPLKGHISRQAVEEMLRLGEKEGFFK